MSKRTQLTRSEVIDVTRVVTDVAVLRGDPARQRQLIADALRRLAECDAGFTFTTADWLPGPAAAPRITASTIASGSEGLFANYGPDVIAYGIYNDPYCGGTIGEAGPFVSVGRRDVLGDVGRQRAHARFVEFTRREGVGDGLVTFARLPDGPADHPDARGRMFGVGMHRFAPERSQISPRARARVDLAVAELAALIPRGHLPLPEFDPARPDPLAGLRPRQREALTHVLAGLHPKAIARAMGLSIWTVREHLSSLYRHFGVAGRDELMARFIER